MDSRFDETNARLEALTAVRDRFEIRAELLPADLALVGLYNEVRDAAFLAVQLCHLHAQSAAFPLARTVFEATQQIIVLATDDDYVGVGTRAWLFHLRKEKRVAFLSRGLEAAEQWFEQGVRDIARIWTTYNADAERILTHENALLDTFQKNRGAPENFMGRDLGKVVEERYPKLAVVFGRSAADLGRLNKGIYTALSRESHAHLRVDAAALRVASNGTVTIVPRKLDEAAKNKLVLGCISSSLSEATAALGYLIGRREKQHLAEIERDAARLIEKPLAAGFKPDLGLHLIRRGGMLTTFHFPNVPVQRVGILPDGTVSWSAEITLAENEIYAATFDVPPTLVPALGHALMLERSELNPSSEPRICKLTRHGIVGLQCTVAEIQHRSSDSFAPLTVTHIVGQGPETENAPN